MTCTDDVSETCPQFQNTYILGYLKGSFQILSKTKLDDVYKTRHSRRKELGGGVALYVEIGFCADIS